jgi:hypothetical protein
MESFFIKLSARDWIANDGAKPGNEEDLDTLEPFAWELLLCPQRH